MDWPNVLSTELHLKSEGKKRLMHFGPCLSLQLRPRSNYKLSNQECLSKHISTMDLDFLDQLLARCWDFIACRLYT